MVPRRPSGAGRNKDAFGPSVTAVTGEADDYGEVQAAKKNAVQMIRGHGLYPRVLPVQAMISLMRAETRAN